MRELSIETYWHYKGPDSVLSLGDVACNCCSLGKKMLGSVLRLLILFLLFLSIVA